MSNMYEVFLYSWNFPVGALDSLYFLVVKSASNEWMPILYTTTTWLAVSFELTDGSSVFRKGLTVFGLGTPVLGSTVKPGPLNWFEPPKRSKWASCMKPRYKGPFSHLTAHDATRGKRFGEVVI